MLATISNLGLFATLASAAYVVTDDYSPSNFASMFDFFTGADPTNGYVNYVDQTTAQNYGLYSVSNGQVYMGVDHTNVASGRGRSSIRLSSKKSYNHGLIVLDLAHMPAGQCGTWPAFWTLGATQTWPNGGEVDIIEGVNTQNYNSMAIHSSNGCSITNTGGFSGNLETDNCYIQAPNQGNNVGCAIHTSNTQTYGAGFNQIGGGVYATEWTSQAISIWFFPRGAIPSDLTSGNPVPANWGLPLAKFAGACDLDSKIFDQQILFDVTFCGDWAGSVWSTDTTCAPKASTCQDYVQNNPSAFKDTYWGINYMRVYQTNGVAAPSSSQAASSSVASTSSSIPSVSTATTATKTVAASTSTVATTYVNTIATSLYNTATVVSTTYPNTYSNTYASQSASVTAPTTFETRTGTSQAIIALTSSAATATTTDSGNRGGSNWRGGNNDGGHGPSKGPWIKKLRYLFF